MSGPERRGHGQGGTDSCSASSFPADLHNSTCDAGIIVPTLEIRKLKLREAPSSTSSRAAPTESSASADPRQEGPGFPWGVVLISRKSGHGEEVEKMGMRSGHLWSDPLSLPLAGPQALMKQLQRSPDGINGKNISSLSLADR